MRKKMAILMVALSLLFVTTNIGFANIYDGLVAYYPFNSNADDVSGNLNHATANGPTLTTDRIGTADSAYNFDYVDDYIELGNGLLPGDTDFSVSVWIKIGDKPFAPPAWKYILDFRGDITYALTVDQGILKVGSEINSGSFGAVPVNQWLHIACAYDDSSEETKVYRNGIYVGSQPGNISHFGIQNRINRIGANSIDSSFDLFDGKIDEVRIYNRVLSPDEIDALGSNTWHVDGNSGNNANDGSSSTSAFATIQYAIDNACYGDTILVWPGVYNEDISFLGKSITVQSAADAAKIEGVGNFAVNFISGEGSGSVLRNMVIANSDTAIHCFASSPTIEWITLADNNLGIWSESGANPVVSHALLWDNTTDDLLNTTATYSWSEENLGDAVDSLVGYWPFDEGSGATTADGSGNGNDGAITAVVWTTGRSGNALDFNGADAYVAMTDNGVLSGMTNLTAAGWFQADSWPDYSIASGSTGIISKMNNGDGTHLTDCFVISMYMLDNQHYITTAVYGENQQIGNNWRIEDAISDFDPLAWHHVALVFNGSEQIAYLDGIEIGRMSTVLSSLHNNTAVPLSIGHVYGNSQHNLYFDGDIDEVAVYTLALAAGEIQQLYNSGSSGYGLGDPLFADVANGDYHLMSARGRYLPGADPNQPGLWVLDEVTSPAIDAGDPAIDPAAEPAPNGGQVNVGAFGNSGFASRSEWPLSADFDRNGWVDYADFAYFTAQWMSNLPWAL